MLDGKLVVTALGLIGCVASVSAKTLIWYRFDEADGQKVVNRANPGTCDAEIKSIDKWGGIGYLGNDPALLPTRQVAFPHGEGVMTDRNAVAEGSSRALKFEGPSTNSCVFLAYANGAKDLYGLTNATYECLFRIPSGVTRPTSGSSAMFPLFQLGKDSDFGFLFTMYNQAGNNIWPFARWKPMVNGAAAANPGTLNYTTGYPPITRDVWHHAAFVIDGEVCRIYIDYMDFGAKRMTGMSGLRSGNNYPLIIGANIYAEGRNFAGEIAEVRISDEVLEFQDMLRPRGAPGPVDDDTLVFCHLGEDAEWFGLPMTQSNKYGRVTGLLNSAPSACHGPRWDLPSNLLVFPTNAPDQRIGDYVRGGVLATNRFPDGAGLRLNRTEDAAAGKTYGAHLYIPDPETGNTSSVCSIPDGDFTFELSFRLDGQLDSSKDMYTATLLRSSWGKCCVYRGDGKLLIRAYTDATNYTDTKSSVRVDDGRWHDMVMTYRKDSGRLSTWLDGTRFDSRVLTLTTAWTRKFTVGAENGTTQVFPGWLDNLRITRRALEPHEFLSFRSTPVADAADPLFAATFDDSLEAGPEASGVGAAVKGVIQKSPDASEPTFVAGRSGAYVMDGVDGVDVRQFSKSLSLNGGYVKWTNDLALTHRDMTVEWFAKYDKLSPSVNFLRLYTGPRISDLYTFTFITHLTLDQVAVSIYAVTNNAATTARFDKQLYHADDPSALIRGADVADRRWHHWALEFTETEAGNTKVRVFRDYRLFAAPVEFNGRREPSAAYLGVGATGVDGASIYGLMGPLRVTPGPADVNGFMRYRSGGGVILIR